MLTEKLLKYQADQQLVCLYRWKEGDSFLVGRISEVTAVSVVLALIDDFGKPEPERDIVIPFTSIYRVEENPAYIERLQLLAGIETPLNKSKGQVTQSSKAIYKRLKEAALTDECVTLTLLSDSPADFRVLRTDRDWCELQQFWDNPTVPTNVALVRYDQISKMQWRSSSLRAVTALWKLKLTN
jgi:hypothetical protein